MALGPVARFPGVARRCVAPVVLSSLALGSVVVPRATAQQHNVLLIVADDLGVDRVGAYHAVTDPGHTPNIDALAANGVLFRNAWALPVCSPSRATLLTGRYPMRTGIGLAIDYVIDKNELPPESVTLPRMLPPEYSRGAVGKWHLSVQDGTNIYNPADVGLPTWRGNLSIFPGFIADSYYSWEKVVDGQVTTSHVYNTTDIVNDSLEWVATHPEPWFLYVGFNAPHAPFHKPPQNLHTYNLPAQVQGNIPVHMKAMTEAMDTEIGRLLSSMAPQVRANTVVVFVGDNGTDKPATTAPFDPLKAKGTIYEGGVHVPLIVAGPDVASGRECQALVDGTDLFSTILELAGAVPPTDVDAHSFAPLLKDPAGPSARQWSYAELFDPNGFGNWTRWYRAARDARYKLHHYYNTTGLYDVRFYDLQADPFETVNLYPAFGSAEAAASFATLTGVLASLVNPEWLDVGHPLAGTAGFPKLAGSGALQAGQTVSITLTGAAPSSPDLLIVGSSWLAKTWKSGVVVPAPFAVYDLFTDPTGSIPVQTAWPAGLPSGTKLFLQHWIADPTAPKGLAASNGLLATVP